MPFGDDQVGPALKQIRGRAEGGNLRRGRYRCGCRKFSPMRTRGRPQHHIQRVHCRIKLGLENRYCRLDLGKLPLRLPYLIFGGEALAVKQADLRQQLLLDLHLPLGNLKTSLQPPNGDVDIRSLGGDFQSRGGDARFLCLIVRQCSLASAPPEERSGR